MAFVKPIILGDDYRLDAKIRVKVIKQINRSGTVYGVETPEGSIITVEKDRLKPIDKTRSGT